MGKYQSGALYSYPYSTFIGNNVPQDILKAISVAVKLNGERESARNKENARTEKIMRTIEKIEFENTMQVLYTLCKPLVIFIEILYRID
jgi:hypothetical protein